MTGNLWSLVAPIKNGNLISLLVYGSINLYVLFTIKDYSKKRLFQTLLWVFLIQASVGLIPASDTLRLSTIHILISLIIGTLYSDYIVFAGIASILYPLTFETTPAMSVY